MNAHHPPSPLLDTFLAMQPELLRWRRHLHAHPELSNQEFQTAAYIRTELQQMGIDNLRVFGGTGVVADIHGGDGPTVGLRADTDALPICEDSGEEFSSRNPGVMHACGHDAHSAMLLGAARHLKTLAAEGELKGTVRLLFQPAEEKQDDDGRSGGQRLVEEGALEGVDFVFAQHISPGIEAGKLSTMVGPITAASDAVEFTIEGAAGHAATPHLACDAIAIAGPIICALHQIVSRNINPLESAVITFGSIHGGTQANVIADKVILDGTVRCFLPPIRQRLHAQIQAIAAMADAMGGGAKVKIIKGYPMTINDKTLTEQVIHTIRTTFGEHTFEEFPIPSTGSEDFGFMTEKIPGCMMRVGVKNPTWPAPRHAHTPGFAIDERALPFGAANLVAQTLAVGESDG